MMLLSGETVALHDNAQVSRAILFWATWCPRSRSDIERFEDLARRYSWRGDIEFYAVSIDKHEDERELLSRIESQDLKTVRHVFSGNDTQDESFLALRGDQLPYAVLIDRRGVVRSITVGVSGLEELLTKKLPSRRPVADE
jgi:thiol-disulfide isomerase/thioredoxin